MNDRRHNEHPRPPPRLLGYHDKLKMLISLVMIPFQRLHDQAQDRPPTPRHHLPRQKLHLSQRSQQTHYLDSTFSLDPPQQHQPDLQATQQQPVQDPHA